MILVLVVVVLVVGGVGVVVVVVYFSHGFCTLIQSLVCNESPDTDSCMCLFSVRASAFRPAASLSHCRLSTMPLASVSARTCRSRVATASPAETNRSLFGSLEVVLSQCSCGRFISVSLPSSSTSSPPSANIIIILISSILFLVFSVAAFCRTTHCGKTHAKATPSAQLAGTAALRSTAPLAVRRCRVGGQTSTECNSKGAGWQDGAFSAPDSGFCFLCVFFRGARGVAKCAIHTSIRGSHVRLCYN